MSVTDLIQAADKLTPAERAEFESAWVRRWNPGYEQRRQEVGRLLRDGWEAAQRGEIVEGTEENLGRIFDQAMAASSGPRKDPAASCPA
jgi:hypothetical protein